MSSRFSVVLLLAFVSLALRAEQRVGDIEFFGYKGINVDAVRKALPVHPGDPYSDTTKAAVKAAVIAAIGKPPTDVAGICCDENGNGLLFIGLPGASSKTFDYNPEPKGADRLPAEIMTLEKRVDNAIETAVRKGTAEEDDSQGYALLKDPAARPLQLEVRRWALQHERELIRVLSSSSFVEDRRVASDVLGYSRQSDEQIQALVNAARDRDDDVRNNATRALGVLVRSNARLARKIPPDTFIAMLNSGTWTDRNKAASLLQALTSTRDPKLLAQIRAGALESLIEMASWRRPGHAYAARMVLGRIRGMPEDRLGELAWKGPVQ